MRNKLIFLSAMVLGVTLMAGFSLINVFNNKPRLAQESKPFSIKTPPGKSISGEITLFSGGLSLQERGATQASKLKSGRSVVHQGERIVTDENGEVVINFDKSLTIRTSPNSDLDIIQTLRQNFVFSQAEGSIQYERMGTVPVSIRALHLLIDQEVGSISIGVNKESGIVSVEVVKGKITVAFNDLELKSKLFTIDEGKQIIFDDSKREMEINDL